MYLHAHSTCKVIGWLLQLIFKIVWLAAAQNYP